MRGGDLYKPKPKPKKRIPKESKKRKAEHIRYSEQIKMFWEESVLNKTDFCFFCGVHMDKRDNIHHLKGRTGDYYLDKEWWINCHNDRHVWNYTQKSVDELKQQPWYNAWLERLKLKSVSLYEKEIAKHGKSLRFNPKLFDIDLDY
jgi:hypothetical protein